MYYVICLRYIATVWVKVRWNKQWVHIYEHWQQVTVACGSMLLLVSDICQKFYFVNSYVAGDWMNLDPHIQKNEFERVVSLSFDEFFDGEY